MRILHFIPTIAARYGGTSTVMPPMLSALRALPGFEFELATTDADGSGRIAPADVDPDLGTVHLLPRDGPKELKGWLRANAQRFEAVHVHSLWNSPALAACAAARRAGLPLVVSPHGMLSAYTWRRGWLKKRAYWWLVQRRALRGATAYHATSAVEAADVRAANLRAPIFEIPLGMESAAFETAARPNWLRERCGPAAGDRPIVLFLSRIHPKKGIVDFLLPAFAALKSDAFLAVAGKAAGPDRPYEAAIRNAIARLGLTGRVALLGNVEPADRYAAFDGAAVFCLPSYSENFGMVVTEAMARNCPVVVSEHVDAGRHAAAAGAGAVVPLSVERIAAELDRVLARGRGGATRAGAGREYVRLRLGWPQIAERMGEMYRAAAGSHRGTGNRTSP